MHGRKVVWMNWWIQDEWKKGRKGRIGGWMRRIRDGKVDGLMNEWLEWMQGWRDGFEADRRMDEWSQGEWIGNFKVGCLRRCFPPFRFREHSFTMTSYFIGLLYNVDFTAHQNHSTPSR